MSEHDPKQAAERPHHVRVHILHVAKQLIAEELGVIAAASRELGHLRHGVEPKIANVLLTFAGIDSETDALPIGRERKKWNSKALEQKDREIADAEQYYRDDAMNAATELIRLLDSPLVRTFFGGSVCQPWEIQVSFRLCDIGAGRGAGLREDGCGEEQRVGEIVDSLDLDGSGGVG